MAFFDWDGNGKKDIFDDMIEYNIYKECTKSEDDDEEDADDYGYSQNNNSVNSNGTGIGCATWFWISLIISIVWELLD